MDVFAVFVLIVVCFVVGYAMAEIEDQIKNK